MKAETRTAGGVLLPESSVKELNEAKVLAVGPGLMDKKGNRIPMGVKEGDKVLIPQVCDSSFRWEVVGWSHEHVLIGRLLFGGSPIKVGEDEFSLFRDHE